MHDKNCGKIYTWNIKVFIFIFKLERKLQYFTWKFKKKNYNKLKWVGGLFFVSKSDHLNANNVGVYHKKLYFIFTNNLIIFKKELELIREPPNKKNKLLELYLKNYQENLKN